MIREYWCLQGFRYVDDVNRSESFSPHNKTKRAHNLYRRQRVQEYTRIGGFLQVGLLTNKPISHHIVDQRQHCNDESTKLEAFLWNVVCCQCSRYQKQSADIVL